MKLEKNKIKKICLIGYLLLFFLLFQMDKNYKLKAIKIEDINSKHMNKNIKIIGEINKIKQIRDNQFIEIKNKESILKGIIFNSNKTLEINKKYIFNGKISKYQNNFEILISNVEIFLSNS